MNPLRALFDWLERLRAISWKREIERILKEPT